MDIFLSKCTNQFYTHLTEHVYQIINEFWKELFILLNLKLLGKVGVDTTFENMKESTFPENILILENVKICKSCIVLPVDIKNIIVFTV